MRRFNSSQYVAALALAVLFIHGRASAQEADTLSISGTFHMDSLQGNVGADLAAVFASGNDHTWTLTLYGVFFSNSYTYVDWSDEWGNFGHDEQYVTRVHATSFSFEFFSPDADILNQVVSQQLSWGGLSSGACVELVNGDYFVGGVDGWDAGQYSFWNLRLVPFDAGAGVGFSAGDPWNYTVFHTDENGYPLVQPQRLGSYPTAITDWRPGNSGTLQSFADLVDIGSSVPPAPPPPPPPLPTLSIADGSVLEGKKGTRRLHLNVTLSWSSSDVVTVNYATADGTALAKSDYTATSGTLTFQPGQTSSTISISLKGDREREANETFTVQLSNAAGATISDGSATATILNDD